MTSNLRVPFGQLPDGRMITASESGRGLACDCVCPQCLAELVAAQGQVVVHHFRHYAETQCAGAAETGLHKFAKQLICERLRLSLPKNFDMGKMLSAKMEAAQAGFRFDVLAQFEQENLGIEILVTHAVDIEKQAKLSSAGAASIEIDLSWLKFMDVPPDEWEKIILDTAPRRWLVPTKSQRDLENRKQREKEAIIREQKRKSEQRLSELSSARSVTRWNESERRERMLREIEEKRKKITELGNKAQKERMSETLEITKRPPCLQGIVERFGGYNKIPDEAMVEFISAQEKWSQYIKSGKHYEIEHEARRKGWI